MQLESQFAAERNPYPDSVRPDNALTNQTTLKSWPVTITVVDLCWGTVLTSVSATLGYIAASALDKATSA
jgi:hypothetical protein